MIVLQWVVVVVLLHVAMDEDMVIVLITSLRTIHVYVVYRLRVHVYKVQLKLTHKVLSASILIPITTLN